MKKTKLSKNTIYAEGVSLVPIQAGEIVVIAAHQSGYFKIDIFSVKKISEDSIEMNLLNVYRDGEWAAPLPEQFLDIVEFSKQRAFEYDIQSPFIVTRIFYKKKKINNLKHKV